MDCVDESGSHFERKIVDHRQSCNSRGFKQIKNLFQKRHLVFCQHPFSLRWSLVSATTRRFDSFLSCHTNDFVKVTEYKKVTPIDDDFTWKEYTDCGILCSHGQTFQILFYERKRIVRVTYRLVIIRRINSNRVQWVLRRETESDLL